MVFDNYLVNIMLVNEIINAKGLPVIDFDAIMYGPRTFDVGVALCYLIRYYD